MAEEALRCFTSLFESVPGMIEDLESVLKTSQENQKQILQEYQGIDRPVDQLDALPRKPSISSSLKSRQSKDDSSPNALRDESADVQEQPPQMTPADALRLAQRKRKTASNCSGKRSGPTKYRSRSLVVVYYDGDIQKRFETVVRNIGVCRNAMRKGKMNAKLDVMARSGSSGSEDSPDESLRGIRKAVNGSSKIWATTPLRKDDGAPAFDKADGFLDKAQTLCEKAAHQVLRDGDCALEISNAKEHLENALKLSEAELPVLQKRAEKAAEKRRVAEEKRKSQTDEKKDETLNEKVENGERYGSPPADLEVDELEVDDSEDDDDGDPSNVRPLVDTLQLSKFQLRSAARISHRLAVS